MSLAQRSVRSSSYNIIASIVQNIVQFGRSILLARLLSPDDFGVYTFATSVVILTKTIPTFGLGGALIHRAPESEGEQAFRVHFTLTTLFTFIWGAVIALVSYFLTSPENRWVVWIILATQMLDNLILTGQTILTKRVQFKRIALIGTIQIIFATIAALVMAALGYGIWSLVATDVVAAVVPVLGYYIVRPVWKPRFGLSKPVVSYFIRFGRQVFASALLQDMLDRISDLWVWGYLGRTQLGYYSRASTFAAYPRRVISAPLADVSVSTYAELKDQRAGLSQAFSMVNFLMVRAGFLFSGLLAIVAPEFIVLVIGAKWLPMLDAFRLMLVYTLLDPIRWTVSNVFLAVGRPEKSIRIRSIQLAVLVISLFLFGTRWGITGAAVAVNLMMVVGTVLLFYQAKRHVDFSLTQMFIYPTAALTGGLLLANSTANICGMNASPWLTASVKTLVFCTAYLATIIIFEKKLFVNYLGMLKSINTKQGLINRN